MAYQLLPLVPLTAYLNANNQWQIDYQIARTDPVILVKIIITGPIGSTCNVYIDNTLIDVTLRGDLNSNELLQPHIIWQGQTFSLIWSSGNGSPATATLMLQSYKEYR